MVLKDFQKEVRNKKNMTLDKFSVATIILILVFVLMAAFLATSTIPEIFKTGSKTDVIGQQLNESLILQHEDEARELQTQHEDEARANQTRHENEQRDIQRYLIVNETNNSIRNLEDHLMKFIRESENRSMVGAADRKAILNEILNVSKQHDWVGLDHNKLQAGQNKVINSTNAMTNETQKMLMLYGENSLTKLLENERINNNTLSMIKNQVVPLLKNISKSLTE
jgi:hypothetical protein